MSLSPEIEAGNFTGFVYGMKETFDFVEKTLSDYKTSYRSENVFKKEGFYIPPQVITLGFIKKRKKFQKRFCVTQVKATSCLIPLRLVLQKLFEQNNILPGILEYMESLKSENRCMVNVVQGERWKKNGCHLSGRVVLPLFLFNDCIEVGNALGGHSGVQKINVTYCSIPTFSPEVKSSLSHIFVTLLTKSSNLKKFGNRKLFEPVKEDLGILHSKGITSKLPNGKDINVYFQLITLIGDNLGLNCIGGFSQNFSTSNYFCHICKAHKDEVKYLVREAEHLLRTVPNYRSDLMKNNSRNTGIKERCILNDLPNFHIILSCAVDPMHNIYEGIAQYDST
nr:PREDICTED: uncharacterized protein LOC109035885 [Bemisia tabaci]